jgi:hypothetical protein
MNNLSWLLYIANVSHNLSTIVIIIWVLWGIAAFKFYDVVYNSEDYKMMKIPTIIFVISIVIGIFLPNRDTVYAIAISEVGEDVLKSEISSKAQQALTKWIDLQLSEPSVGGKK